jgi:hypothetical protein
VAPGVVSPVPSALDPAASRSAPSPGAVKVRYLEHSPIVVRGPATGRHYVFSGDHPAQLVDRRDADSLLQTRFFRRGY